MRFIKHNGLVINEGFLALLKDNGLDGFESLMKYRGGKVCTEKKLHSVVRVELGEGEERRAFYLKRHYRPGGGFIRGMLPLPPREDGRNEWEKIALLTGLGIQTMLPVAFGEKSGLWGLPGRSLTLTEEIYGTERVETYIPSLARKLPGYDGVREKRGLIRRLGSLARDFHSKGLHHQDFYLGHFFIRPATGELFLIDLQRVHRRIPLPERLRIKDLAQFAFSVLGVENFSRTDLVRFAYAYLGEKRFDKGDKRVIRRVLKKAEKIARHTEKLLACKRAVQK
jgi:heptose I phosphotransferase